MNTSWMMAEKIFGIIMALSVGIYVARYLGPERFGLLSFAMSFVTLFQAISKLGLDGIIIRNIVNDPSKRDEILGTALVLRFLGSILLLFTVYVALQFTSASGYVQLLVMIIAAAHILYAFEIIIFFFQSQVLGRCSSMAGIGSLLVSSTLKLVLILNHASLIWFAIAVLLEHSIKSLILVFLYIRHYTSIFSWHFKALQTKKLLQDSWPLILSGIVIMIYMRIDQVMINQMLGPEAVGNYAAAVRLSEAWYFIPMVITQSLFPAILNAKKKDEYQYYRNVQRLYILLFWIAVAVAFPISLLSGWLIDVLYGSQYAQASSVLIVHVWTGVFVSLGVAKGKHMMAENIQWYSSVCSTTGAITNVVLNYYLIGRYGIIGAAYSTMLAQIISVLLVPLLHSVDRKSVKLMVRAILVPKGIQYERQPH